MKRPPFDPMGGLRRYLARNHPRLWLIRAHLIALSVALVALAACAAGIAMPVSLDHIAEIESWHMSLFVLATVVAFYWLLNYILVLDTTQLPPRIGEPPVAFTMAAMIVIVAPTYLFEAITSERIRSQFPDPVSEARNLGFLNTLGRLAGDNGADILPILDPFATDDPNARVEADGQLPRKIAFKRGLACGMGQAFLPEIGWTKPLELAAPDVGTGVATETQYTGKAVAGEGGLSRPAEPRHMAVWNLLERYRSKLNYTYETSVDSSQPITVTLDVDCQAIDDALAETIVDDMKKAFADIVRAYKSPQAEPDIQRLTDLVFVPRCEYGDLVKDCLDRRLKFGESTRELDLERLQSNFNAIQGAYGKFYNLAIAPPIVLTVAGEPASFPAREPREFEANSRNQDWWIYVVLLTAGWCAIVAKSIRLAKERSSDLVLAAVVFIAGALIVAVVGEAWIAQAIEYVANYFNMVPPEISLNLNYLFISYSTITLIYCSFAIIMRHNYRFSGYISQFNLFYFVIITFPASLVSYGFVNEIFHNLNSTIISYVTAFVYIVWFAVIYEVYYWAAVRLKGRPS